jgi:glucokinase
MQTSATDLWAGVDLGGTGTRVVLVDEAGHAAAGATVPTRSFDPNPIARLADLITSLVPQGRRLTGLGIGASGPVDLNTGLIHNPDTLPHFDGLDVAGELARRLSTPTWIDNDAVVAGLAESSWGLAASAGSLLCVTLGTGIGVAMINGGTPVRAADGQHPEGGHISVAGTGHPCYCGLAQCWEQVASRSALDRLRAAPPSEDAALWETYAGHLASGLITLLTVYRPAAIVLGGSGAQYWATLEAPLRRALAPSREFSRRPLLAASQLGDRAGALGASLLPRRHIGWNGPT